MALLAFGRRTLLLLSAGRAAIDRYVFPAGLTAANLPQRVCCCGPVLRDRRTDTVPLYRRCCAYYAGSANEEYQRQDERAHAVNRLT